MAKPFRLTIMLSAAGLAGIGGYLLKSYTAPQPSRLATATAAATIDATAYHRCLADNLQAASDSMRQDENLPALSKVSLHGQSLTTRAAGDDADTVLNLGSVDQEAVYKGKTYTAAADQSAYFRNAASDLPRPEQAARALGNLLTVACPLNRFSN